LMTGELNRMLVDLVEALGGEMKEKTLASGTNG
jgi:DNA recombination-dependent growth factor C